MAAKTVQLQSSPRAPAEARDLLKRLGVDSAARDPYAVLLAVSELVTNAVRHEGTSERIEVSYLHMPGLIRIEVHPAGRLPTAPMDAWPRPDVADGRGLGIVAAVSSRSGTRAGTRGPVAWCEFETA